MPSAPDETVARQRRSRAIGVLILTALGVALTLYAFYPGVMTVDANFVYRDIAKNFRGDWQSPVMGVVWAVIDPIAPGAASMFLFMILLYWLAFALIGLTLARRSWLAFALPILAVTPPAFLLAGTLWRDILLAAAWLLAAALAFATEGHAKWLQRAAQALALVLIAFGILLRPNLIPAAPLLVAYVLWPSAWRLRRTAILYPVAFVIGVVLVPFVYYGLLNATRLHPLHSVFVFDLGGITYFTGENQYPADWTPEQMALLTGHCYPTRQWDIYWGNEPCGFVMTRLEREKIFGSDTLVTAWRRAIVGHPLAYLAHRATYMTKFLTGNNLVMWTKDADDTEKPAFPDRAAFAALIAIQDALQPTWLLRSVTWLALCLLLCALAWQRRATPAGAFVLGLCGSAALYVASYFFFGVASDYRYAYWAVLASLAGIPVLLAQAVSGRA